MKTRIFWGGLFGLAAVLAGIFLLGGLSSRAIGEPAADIIDVSELKPGMRGYGLTVFRGSEVERFDVEVMDILPNELPRQDMILVKVTGHDLERTRVIAGMSGSPVFFEGKLAGAVSYSFPFALDPVGLVTPIKYMLKTMEPGGPVAAAPADFSLAAAPPPGTTGLIPIASPLMASGFSPEGMAKLARELSPYGFIPAAGGGLARGELDPAAAKAMKPGDAVGALLMSGDLAMHAIGTLTWRSGDKIIAFGHPFFQAGRLSLPLCSARIHTVLASQYNSFKIGSATAVVGRLTMDGQAAIAGELGQTAPMIPLKIKVHNAATGVRDEFNVSVARNYTLTPILIKIALEEAIYFLNPTNAPTTVRIKTKLEIADYGAAEYEDVYPISRGAFSLEFLDPVIFIARNPFAELKVERVEMDVEITDALKVAFIDSVSTESEEAAAGSTVTVGVVLQPYRAEKVKYQFQVPIPEGADLRQLVIQVMGGMKIMPDEAEPTNVPELLRLLKLITPMDHLVVAYKIPGGGVDVGGLRLKTLPPSISSMLQPANSTATAPVPELKIFTQATPYVIVGSQRIMLKIRAPGTRRR